MLKDLTNFLFNFNCKYDIGNQDESHVLHKKYSQITQVSYAVQELTNLQSQQPKLFSQEVHVLLQILQNSIQQQNHDAKLEIYRTILNNIQKLPKYYKNHLPIIIKFVLLICNEISIIIPSNRNKWLHLEQMDELFQNYSQFEDNYSEYVLVFKYSNCIVHLIQIPLLKLEIILKQIYQSLKAAYYQQANIKLKASVYVCIAHFYKIQNLEKLQPFLDLIYQQGLNNTEQIIRFTSLYGLTSLINNHRTKFQQKYITIFIPIIYQGILSETVQQIISRWLRCFCAMIDCYQNNQNLTCLMGSLISRICSLLQNCNSIQIISETFQTMISLSTIPGLLTSEMSSKFVQIYVYMINKSLQSKQFEQILCKSCQYLTQFIKNLNYDIIEEFLQFCLKKIWQISNRIKAESLLICWQNFCLCGKKFSNWKLFHQKIITLIQPCLAIESEQIQLKFSSYRVIQLTAALFQEQYSNQSCILINKLLPILQNLCIEQQFQNIQYIFHPINAIIEKAKVPYTQNLHSFLFFCFQKIESIDVGEQESQSEIKLQLLFTIKSILSQYFRFMNLQTAQGLLIKFWNLTQYFRMQKVKLNEIEKQLQQDIQNDKQVLPDDGQSQQESNIQNNLNSSQTNQDTTLTSVDNCRIVLPQILSKILKLLPNPEILVPRILEQISIQHKNKIDIWDIHQIMLFISVLVEDLSYESIKTYWKDFIKFLADYAQTKQSALRHTLVYCIGVMAQKVPSQFTSEIQIKEWVEIINKCFSTQKTNKEIQTEIQSEDEKQYQHCQDNCISAVGKIIYKFHKIYNIGYLYEIWLQKLPLVYDEVQNRIQMKYLCQIINKQPESFMNQPCIQYFNQSQKYTYIIIKILKIFVRLKSLLFKLPKSKENKQLYFQSKKTARSVLEWAIFKQNQTNILKGLEQKDKMELSIMLA